MYIELYCKSFYIFIEILYIFFKSTYIKSKRIKSPERPLIVWCTKIRKIIEKNIATLGLCVQELVFLLS